MTSSKILRVGNGFLQCVYCGRCIRNTDPDPLLILKGVD